MLVTSCDVTSLARICMAGSLFPDGPLLHTAFPWWSGGFVSEILQQPAQSMVTCKPDAHLTTYCSRRMCV